MSYNPEKIRNFKRAALFIVPLYFVVAAGFAVSPRTPAISPNTVSSRDFQSISVATTSAIITRVIDGDTADVLIGDKTERVRLIGIDTPETVDPRKPVQCFGKEASARTKEILQEGMLVTLASDPTQDDRDKYGRLLRYISTPDRSDAGFQLISEGYAHEYTYQTPYQKQAKYQSAEKAARTEGLGLWAKDTCAGKTS